MAAIHLIWPSSKDPIYFELLFEYWQQNCTYLGAAGGALAPFSGAGGWKCAVWDMLSRAFLTLQKWRWFKIEIYADYKLL